MTDWTLEHSIGLTHFSGTRYRPDVWMSGEDDTAIVSSPDGRYFYFVSHHGDLARDSNVYQLFVYEVARVRRALEDPFGGQFKTPLITKKFETFSSWLPAIEQVGWLSDSSGILLLRTDDRGQSQVHRLSIPSGEVAPLVDIPDRIQKFAFRDGAFVYSARTRVSVPTAKQRAMYPMFAVDRATDGSARLSPDVGRERTEYGVYVSYHGRPRQKLDGVFSFDEQWIAPGGRQAIMLQLKGRARRFMLVDIVGGKVRELLNADVGREWIGGGSERGASLPRPAALWGSDDKRVILVNTLLPEARGAGAPPGDQETGYIVDYDVANRQWRVIEALSGNQADGKGQRYVSQVRSDGSGEAIIVVHQGAGEFRSAVRYVRSGGDWTHSETDLETASGATDISSGKLAGGLAISVRQGANDPPTVVATDGRNELTLRDADPSLAGVWLARVEPVTWRESDGTTQTGGLLLPRNSVPGAAPAVVIQVGEYSPKFFRPDGISSSAYLAQALVAKGFAVLEISQAALRGIESGTEGARIVERLDRAVETLAGKRLVDATRVGVVGFSRNGFETFYALTHPGKQQFGAVASVDSFTGSFSSYLGRSAFGTVNGDWREFEYMPGGPFWDRKEQWLEHDVIFNVDRVRTPALFIAHAADYETFDHPIVEVIGAFRLNRKPLEYLFFPDAAHALIRPRQRFSELHAIGEWMLFWLQGQTPADNERARRWSALRVQQDEVLRQVAKSRSMSSAIRPASPATDAREH